MSGRAVAWAADLAGDLARLSRARVCLLTAAGTAAGYVSARPALDAGLLAAAGAMFLLAAGGSALNQAQERREDGLMRRTAGRPLPARRMGLGQVILFAALCLGLALALLAGGGGTRALALALGGLAVYNGLYTPLKRRTPLAILVGGLAGALPPLLGWAAAGASPLDPRALLLGAIFYLWQVPHFGLLVRLHREDFAAAGLPLAGLAGVAGAPRLPLGGWLAAYCAALVMLPVWGLVPAGPAGLAVLAGAALLAGLAGLAPRLKPGLAGLGFALVNLSLVLVLAGLAAGALAPAA